MAGRELPAVELEEAERAELVSLASRRSTVQALALRARIILACAEGGQNKTIAERMGLDRGRGRRTRSKTRGSER